MARFNYDHTFQPTLLNHFAAGYLDLPTKLYTSSDCCVSQLPVIPGVYNHAHASGISFSEYDGYGGSGDEQSGEVHVAGSVRRQREPGKPG